MFKKHINLDKLQVNQPCSTDWESMAGDDKKRFCSQCSKSVYNLSAMTRGEAEAIVRETGGKFCARILKDSNGSVLTVESPYQTRLSRFHHPKFSSFVAAITLSFCTNVGLFTKTEAKDLGIYYSSRRFIENRNIQPYDSVFDPLQVRATVKGTVSAPTGAVIVDAKVQLINADSGEEFDSQTSDDGSFIFEHLPNGIYKLEVSSQGFVKFKVEKIEISDGTNRNFLISLQVGSVGGCEYNCDKINESMIERIPIPELLLKPINAIKNRIDKLKK